MIYLDNPVLEERIDLLVDSAIHHGWDALG